ELCSDQILMQDVWVTPLMKEVPCWLEDLDIRNEIHALLKCDYCRKEQICLGEKTKILCWFLENQLTMLELSINYPKESSILAIY
ncbi:hypothetical protein BDR05DRAFT_896595, partial [Suillus weaverae]